MTASANNDKHVPLKGSRRYLRANSQVLGRSDRQEWCEVTVKVRRKAALPEPVPGKPISRADLASRYGADTNDLDTVEKVLAPFGLTVLSKNAAAQAVKLAGPVSAMERAFGVQLFRVKHSDLLYRGRVGEIHIPQELDDVGHSCRDEADEPSVAKAR